LIFGKNGKNTTNSQSRPLNLAAMAASAYSRLGGQCRKYFHFASFFAFIFSLDQDHPG
jgi:hypothetical protein